MSAHTRSTHGSDSVENAKILKRPCHDVSISARLKYPNKSPQHAPTSHYDFHVRLFSGSAFQRGACGAAHPVLGWRTPRSTRPSARTCSSPDENSLGRNVSGLWCPSPTFNSPFYFSDLQADRSSVRRALARAVLEAHVTARHDATHEYARIDETWKPGRGV